MKYEYPGGIMDYEKNMIERFEDHILPFTIKNGPKIGESAMNGDAAAEEIIRRQRLFVEGVPEMRFLNFKLLNKAIKLWRNSQCQ